MVALEHPLSANVREITIEVAAPAIEVAAPEEPTPPLSVNQIPFFVEAPPATFEVTKTDSLTAWSYKLPAVTDEDEDDIVEVTYNLGNSTHFVNFDASDRSLDIADLSDPLVSTGNFTITFTLDDSKDKQSYSLILIVNPLPEPDTPLEEEASTTNSTSAETNSTIDESATPSNNQTSSSIKSA